MYAGRSSISSKDSVASVPPSAAGSKRYVHLVDGPRLLVTKANSRPGSAATTSGFVLQRITPRLLVPLKRAPTAGPVAPPIHSHLAVSGLHSPMRVTSDTRSYSFSGGALTWTCASPRVPFFMRPSVLAGARREQL